MVERFGFAFTYQFEDPDNFCVSDNALIGILPIIARRSSHKIGIVIGVSSRLIQAFYCCFLEFVEAVIAPRLCDIYSACAVKFFVCPVPIYPVMRVFDIITNLVLFIRKTNPNMRGLQSPLFVDIHKLNVDNFPLPIIKWNCMCALRIHLPASIRRLMQCVRARLVSLCLEGKHIAVVVHCCEGLPECRANLACDNIRMTRKEDCADRSCTGDLLIRRTCELVAYKAVHVFRVCTQPL